MGILQNEKKDGIIDELIDSKDMKNGKKLFGKEDLDKSKLTL